MRKFEPVKITSYAVLLCIYKLMFHMLLNARVMANKSNCHVEFIKARQEFTFDSIN